ncbi:NAD-dependent epimerase/dehydratase family protein [Algoriphagus machipongonensis]|uniref:Dihydroflavonol 4-reductase n=1 Tax=Algoriphagus machipongonensis TaxID=388413 RepID=A3HU61_9BACT|nr:NAD-dependent epimerase/dehydratase family protein [Algoriphagus machipongonensis]EAZ81683.1 putative dihydroflavonol 4-reductase [Algoriphagus machipongonensis]
MKIFITGITGLLGSYVAKEFSSLGEIHGFKRPNSSTRLLDDVDFPIQWHEGTLGNVESIDHALEGMDLVIHCAGKVSFLPSEEEELYKVNVQGTRNLVNAMLYSGVKKLIHISSVSALGRSPEISEVNEDHKWVDSPWNTKYGMSKYWGELEVWRAEQEGLDLIVVNPSILLGKISDDRSSTSIYSHVLNNSSYFPKGSINYLDVRDAAKLIRLLFEKNSWGERFILNQGNMKYQEFFKKMAVAFDKKVPEKPVSMGMLKLLLFSLSVARTLGLTKSPLTKQTAMISQQDILFENQKIKDLLDFDYTPVEDTFIWAK